MNLWVCIGEKVLFLLKWNNERKQGEEMLFEKTLKPCLHGIVLGLWFLAFFALVGWFFWWAVGCFFLILPYLFL